MGGDNARPGRGFQISDISTVRSSEREHARYEKDAGNSDMDYRPRKACALLRATRETQFTTGNP